MNLDRLLALSGIIVGLPGFFFLFLSANTVVSSIAVFFGFSLLAAAYLVFYFSGLPPYSVRNADVTLTLHDGHGKAATLSKEYEIRPNYRHLSIMTHRNIASDGETLNISWDDKPVSENDIKKILGEYEVTIKFPNTLKRWRNFKGKLSYSVQDSFLQDHEGIHWVADFPTKNAKIRIILPDDRPCKRSTSYKILGAQKVAFSEPHISKNGKSIELEIKRPPIGSEYAIYWDW